MNNQRLIVLFVLTFYLPPFLLYICIIKDFTGSIDTLSLDAYLILEIYPIFKINRTWQRGSSNTPCFCNKFNSSWLLENLDSFCWWWDSTPLSRSRTSTPFAGDGIQLLLVAQEPWLLLLAMGFNSSWLLENLDSFCWRWDSTPLSRSRTSTPFANGGIQLLLAAREPRQRAKENP